MGKRFTAKKIRERQARIDRLMAQPQYQPYDVSPSDPAQDGGQSPVPTMLKKAHVGRRKGRDWKRSKALKRQQRQKDEEARIKEEEALVREEERQALQPFREAWQAAEVGFQVTYLQTSQPGKHATPPEELIAAVMDALRNPWLERTLKLAVTQPSLEQLPNPRVPRWGLGIFGYIDLPDSPISEDMLVSPASPPNVDEPELNLPPHIPSPLISPASPVDDPSDPIRPVPTTAPTSETILISPASPPSDDSDIARHAPVSGETLISLASSPKDDSDTARY